MHIQQENQENQGAQLNEQVTLDILTQGLSRPVLKQERVEFYTGKDRMTLQVKNIHRVRELQETNDNLQRQVRENELSLPTSHDPLTIIAQIEQLNILISRNTGEILNIHVQNERRLARIAQLEAENINLQQDIADYQGKFTHCHELNDRAGFAAEFFLSRAQYEKNLAEIRELSHQ
jgi:hypothetical protein